MSLDYVVVNYTHNFNSARYAPDILNRSWPTPLYPLTSSEVNLLQYLSLCLRKLAQNGQKLRTRLMGKNSFYFLKLRLFMQYVYYILPNHILAIRGLKKSAYEVFKDISSCRLANMVKGLSIFPNHTSIWFQKFMLCSA